MMADNGKTKGSELHYQSDFLHDYYMFKSVHNGNHDSVVRIFVDLSCELWGFFDYITRYNFSLSGV